MQRELTPRIIHETNLKNTKQSFILFAIMTAVNLVTVLSGLSFSFSFSAFLPSILAEMSVAFRDMGLHEISTVYLTVSIVFTSAMLLLAFFIFKKPVILPISLALMILDTAVMVFYIVFNISRLIASPLSLLIHVLLHVWMLYYLISSVVSVRKNRENPEKTVYDAEFTEIEDEENFK